MAIRRTRSTGRIDVANAPRNAGVYARYSSDNQKATSIDDQVLACFRFAKNRGDIVVLRDHIYEDRARSRVPGAIGTASPR